MGHLFKLSVGLQQRPALRCEGGAASVSAALASADQRRSPFFLHNLKDLPPFAVGHPHPLTGQTHGLRLFDKGEQIRGPLAEKRFFSSQTQPQFRKNGNLRVLEFLLNMENCPFVLDLESVTGSAAGFENFTPLRCRLPLCSLFQEQGQLAGGKSQRVSLPAGVERPDRRKRGPQNRSGRLHRKKRMVRQGHQDALASFPEVQKSCPEEIQRGCAGLRGEAEGAHMRDMFFQGLQMIRMCDQDDGIRSCLNQSPHGQMHGRRPTAPSRRRGLICKKLQPVDDQQRSAFHCFSLHFLPRAIQMIPKNNSLEMIEQKNGSVNGSALRKGYGVQRERRFHRGLSKMRTGAEIAPVLIPG